MPNISTKPHGPLLAGDSHEQLMPRVDRARRRIDRGYYDRPEVRRTLAALILRRVLLRKHRGPEGDSPAETP